MFSKQTFDTYVDYIDRDEAVRNSAFSSYSAYVTDYMDDSKKQKLNFNPESERTSALFTETKDQLSKDEKRKLKEQFRKAQAAASPMWQNVLSFDNRFLEQHGIYDSKTGMVDEAKMRNITRLAMKEMVTNEGMEASAVWSASIHFNTDNIHIHIAVVQPSPTRERKEYNIENRHGEIESQKQYKGRLKPSTFTKMRSKVVNNIVDRSDQLKEINDIIRNNILAQKKNNLSYEDKKMKGAFLKIYKQLPKDKRLWFYNMNALYDIRPQIDEFTKQYINRYHKEDFQKLQARLNEEQEFLKSAYGSGNKKLYENYADTKIADLYTRMGNALLTELRKYDTLVRSESCKRGKEKLQSRKRISQGRTHSIYDLKKALAKDFQSMKNQMEFQNLQQSIDRASPEIEGG